MGSKFALFLALALAAGPLRAFDYAGKWGVTLSGGYDNTSMADVNEELSKAGGNLTNGLEGNLGLSYGVTPGILITADVGELYNHDNFTGGSITLPALSFQLGEQYVAWTSGPFDLSVCGALEYDALDGNTSIDPGTFQGNVSATSESRPSASSLRHASDWGGGGTPTGTAPSGQTYIVTNCVGSTIGAQLGLKANYFFTGHIGLGLEAGYRYSHIYQVMGTTDKVTGKESETVDYSGFLSKLSASYFF